MAVSDSFLDIVIDQLRGLGRVAAKRMFGGAGLYARGRFFAIVFDDALYLKVDAGNRTDYVASGMPPFRPFPGRPTTLQYYLAPAAGLESPDRLVEWAQRALAAAGRAPRRRKRRPGRARSPRLGGPGGCG